MKNINKQHKVVLPAGEELKKTVQSILWQQAFQAMLRKMPEHFRRWNAALLAIQLGYGGMKITCEISGLSFPAVKRGRVELESGLADWGQQKIRRPGGGRKLLEEKQPELLDDLKKMVDGEIAGNPSSDDRWVDRSSHKLAVALRKKGYDICQKTVLRLLKKLD